MDRFRFEQAKPDDVEVVYRWRCCKCGAVKEMKILGEHVQYPSWPANGWILLPSTGGYSGGWLCEAHELKIYVDGDEHVYPRYMP